MEARIETRSLNRNARGIFVWRASLYCRFRNASGKGDCAENGRAFDRKFGQRQSGSALPYRPVAAIESFPVIVVPRPLLVHPLSIQQDDQAFGARTLEQPCVRQRRQTAERLILISLD